MRESPPLSVHHEAPDGIEAIEYCYRQGWTDGLPVVPPTEELVAALLAAAGRPPEEVLGVVPERRRTVTVEKVAANAVMAGCLPPFFPVVLAAVEALLDPQFSLIGPSSSTAGAAPLVIVNGPIVAELGLNAGDNLLGPGNRANATIGRALRLVLLNACGAVPGLFDRSCFGHPGKYTFCIAENEAESAWPPLHVERGVPAAVSAVTVFAAQGPVQVDSRASPDVETVLAALASRMVANCTFLNEARRPEVVVVIGDEHRRDLTRAGWDKARIRAWLFEHAQTTVGALRRVGRRGPGPEPDDRPVRVVARPEDILIVAAGGQAGRYSLVIPGWPGGDSRAVTKAIGVCLDCA